MPDKIDTAILRELMSPHSLQWDVRKSLAEIAERVPVDEDTVRRRLQKFYDTGFVKRWELVVNPSLLGFRGSVAEIATYSSQEKESLLARIKQTDGVRWIFNYYGDGLAAIFFHQDESAQEDAMDLISPASGKVEISDWSVPPSNIKLSATDWKLVWNLRREPRKSYASLAKEVGMSTRTAMRRIARMSEAKAFFLDADLDVRMMKGVLPCDVRVWCDDPASKKKVRQRLLSELENIVYTNEQTPELYFVVACGTVAEADDMQKRVSQMEGVRRARTRIVQERFSVTKWFDDQLAKKL